MKNYITLILLFNFIPCFNNGAMPTKTLPDYTEYLEKPQVNSKTFELITHYKSLLKAILTQESACGRRLVGDGGRAIGPLQLHKILVDDANQILKEKKYTYEDRMSIEKSLEMFLVYQEFYNPSRDLEKAARIWNGGPRAMELGISIGYWEDIQKLMDNPKDELLAEILINSANIQAV